MQDHARRPVAHARFTARILFGVLLAFMAGWCQFIQAQWITQTNVIKPGWSGVYMNVDASYQVLDQLVGSDSNNPIVEIWYWQTPTTPAQIVPFQSTPAPSADWLSWVRAGYTNYPGGALAQLIPNAAFLVHSIATNNYTWQVKGKPVPPSYSWTSSGLNFIGFRTPAVNPPTVTAFLAPAPTLAGWLQSLATGQRAPGIYRYNGGALGANNPSVLAQIFWGTTPVTRGQAFWVDAGPTYNNNYFGPFQVTGMSSSGVALGSSSSQSTFTLNNVTSSNLVVTVQLLASETAPAGQTNAIGVPPVLIRGGLIASNLTYPAIALAVNGTTNWTLAPQGQGGSQITVAVGVNRSQMTATAGSLYAGILRFTDALNLSQVDVPISAQASSAAGLWVGKAAVSQVANYLKTYQVDQYNNPVINTNGSYIVTSINTNLGAVPQSYPFRLILHNDGTNVVLLQHVFYGLNLASNTVVALHETALDPTHLVTARRISAANFPWTSTNQAWSCIGRLAPGTNLTVTVTLPYDDQASNPFLHTYHPDHDNLDATFQNKLPRGSESYDITRQITLSFSPPGSDFTSLTAAGQTFYGTYLETITVSGLGTASRKFNVTGTFTLNQISPINSLTRL
jgi:hypothetical protein